MLKSKPLEFIIEALLKIIYLYNSPHNTEGNVLVFPPSEMVDCFNEIAVDPDCRVVVVSGAGKIFTAGGCRPFFKLHCLLCKLVFILRVVLPSRYRSDGHGRRRTPAGGRRRGQNVLEHEKNDRQVSGDVFRHREGHAGRLLLFIS